MMHIQNLVKQQTLSFKKSLITFFLASLALITLPMQQALAAAGYVQFATGHTVAVAADGQERVLAKGAEISAGDTIKTTDGLAQLRFADGSYISLQANTQFKIEDYNYSGKVDGTEKSVFSFIKGGLRAITGAIGKTNKQNFRMNTPVATIGIRGTEWLQTFDGQKLLIHVGSGAVYVSNAAGDLVLYQGQTGEVLGKNIAPKYLPNALHRLPNNLQSGDSQANDTPEFIAGEVRTSDGLNSAIVNPNSPGTPLDTGANLNSGAPIGCTGGLQTGC